MKSCWSTMKKTAAGVFGAFALAMALAVGFAAVPAHDAYAANSSQTITVSVDGTSKSSTFTYAQLAAATDSNGDSLIKTNTLGFLYYKSGEWYVVGEKSYIELNDLFALAGVTSSEWGAGSILMFKTTDYPEGYEKYSPTYEECTRTNYFYGDAPAAGAAPLTSKSIVPTVLAFDYAQVKVPTGSTASAVLSSLTPSDFTSDTRFGVGLDDTNVNTTGDGNMGKRLPSMITEIVVIPA